MPSKSDHLNALARAEQDGLDLSLLRERLRLTPTERLQRHQVALEMVEALRGVWRKRQHVSGRESADGSMRR